METGSAAGGKLIIPASIGMTAFSLQVKPQSQTVAVYHFTDIFLLFPSSLLFMLHIGITSWR